MSMGKKLAGVLPKNAPDTIPYKEPKRRKRVEVEEADDGSFSIRCYGTDGMDYQGSLKTAASIEDLHSKVSEHFGKKKTEKKG